MTANYIKYRKAYFLDKTFICSNINVLSLTSTIILRSRIMFKVNYKNTNARSKYMSKVLSKTTLEHFGTNLGTCSSLYYYFEQVYV